MFVYKMLLNTTLKGLTNFQIYPKLINKINFSAPLFNIIVLSPELHIHPKFQIDTTISSRVKSTF